MFEITDTHPQEAVIKVIGIGGCGGNAIDHMISEGIEGVEFICANTDAQALRKNKTKNLIQIGAHITKGLGAGAKPDVGKQAAIEDRERIIESIETADMVFITAGMGGGTGTGAAPVVAEAAKELGILTVAVVTKPFLYEKNRAKIADDGLVELTKHVDSLITIPNDKLLEVLGDEVSLEDAYKEANSVLYGAVSGIAEVIKSSGLVNVDFADVKTVMSENGMAMMGSAIASGISRAEEAAKKAVSSPLLEDVDLKGARGVLVNIAAGSSLGLKEVHQVMDSINSFTADEATVIVGTVLEEELGENLRVTMVATGLGPAKKLAVIPSHEIKTGTDNSSLNSLPHVIRPRSDSLQTDNLDVPTFLRKQAD